jgi:alkanesulfonate monooxygenase SsuD/methylene tetrahydromethanopterin reductase-like flavin-dependent oxidoreductase (luciferase family)
VPDPEVALAVARAAEDAGVDGVFVYDHLFRAAADGRRRPALEPVALLGAVCAATDRIVVGTLVARASLRPAASLRAAFSTLARLAPGRLVAGIGAGDSQSQPEHDAFGVPAGSAADRVTRLRDAVLAVRGDGYPIWGGGPSRAVRAVAADLADGWNQWGGTATEFEQRTRPLHAAAGRPFVCSWGGLVVLDVDDATATAKAAKLHADRRVIVGGPARVADALRAYRAAGADWVIAGPLDSRDPANATRLGEQVRPRLSP